MNSLFKHVLLVSAWNTFSAWRFSRIVARGYSNYYFLQDVAGGFKPLPVFKDFFPVKMADLIGFLNFCKLGSISKGFLA